MVGGIQNHLCQFAEAPNLWKLKELRERYRDASPEERVPFVRAGRAIREMEAMWPDHSPANVRRVLAAVRSLR